MKRGGESPKEECDRATRTRDNQEEKNFLQTRKILNQSGERIADLDFTASSSTSPSENEENSELMVLDEPRVSGERSGTDTASLVSSMTTMDAGT